MRRELSTFREKSSDEVQTFAGEHSADDFGNRREPLISHDIP
jgi:hypothetical protein